MTDEIKFKDHFIKRSIEQKVNYHYLSPKYKHLKQPLLKALAKLKKDGVVHIATDWENYAEHIMELLESHSHFKNCAGDHMYSSRPKNRPLTKFENRGQKLGHGVWDIIFTNIKGG